MSAEHIGQVITGSTACLTSLLSLPSPFNNHQHIYPNCVFPKIRVDKKTALHMNNKHKIKKGPVVSFKIYSSQSFYTVVCVLFACGSGE